MSIKDQKLPITKKPAPQPQAKPQQTKDGYQVPEGEEGLFHVEYERPAYDPFDGEKLSMPYTQKFHPQDFALQLQPNEFGVPLYASIGLKMNKLLFTPDESLFEKIRVNVKPGHFIYLKEMLEKNETYMSQKKKR